MEEDGIAMKINYDRRPGLSLAQILESLITSIEMALNEVTSDAGRQVDSRIRPITKQELRKIIDGTYRSMR